MKLQNAIKQSLLFSFLLKIKKYADNSKLFSIDIRKDKKSYHKNYKTWINSSIIYRFFMYIDSLLNKVEKVVFEGINSSLAFSFIKKPLRKKHQSLGRIRIIENSLLYKIFCKFFINIKYTDLLIFIPTSYVVIDYIIRRTPFLVRFGSIWDELVLILCFGIYILSRIFSGGKLKHNFTPMDLPIIIYIVLGTCHLLIKSPEMGIAIEGFRAVYQHILWYFIATQFVRNIKDSAKVINLMCLIGLFLGVHATYQYIVKVPMPGNWVDIGESISTRAFSIIGSPNVLGSIFVLFIPISFSMGLTKEERYSKLFYFGTSIFMVAGLLFTMSRGAWLAFAFGVFIYIIILVPKLVTPFTGLGATFILFGGALSERLLYMLSPVYMSKSSQGGRIYRWQIGLDIWKKNQMFGLGLGRYGGAVAMNNNLAPFYLDNYYLKTLTEMGLFGMSGFIFLIISFVVFTINIVNRQEDLRNRIMTIGLFAGCIGVLVQNFVENIFEVPAMVAYFWIAVALINNYAPKTDANSKCEEA